MMLDWRAGVTPPTMSVVSTSVSETLAMPSPVQVAATTAAAAISGESPIRGARATKGTPSPATVVNELPRMTPIRVAADQRDRVEDRRRGQLGAVGQHRRDRPASSRDETSMPMTMMRKKVAIAEVIPPTIDSPRNSRGRSCVDCAAISTAAARPRVIATCSGPLSTSPPNRATDSRIAATITPSADNDAANDGSPAGASDGASGDVTIGPRVGGRHEPHEHKRVGARTQSCTPWLGMNDSVRTAQSTVEGGAGVKPRFTLVGFVLLLSPSVACGEFRPSGSEQPAERVLMPLLDISWQAQLPPLAGKRDLGPGRSGGSDLRLPCRPRRAGW